MSVESVNDPLPEKDEDVRVITWNLASKDTKGSSKYLLMIKPLDDFWHTGANDLQIDPLGQLTVFAHSTKMHIF